MVLRTYFGRQCLGFFHLKCFYVPNNCSRKYVCITYPLQYYSQHVLNCSRSLITSSTHMKGHSEWQNRIRFKEVYDKQRADLTAYHCQQIRRSIRDGDSKDPKLNSKLASAIQYAINNNIPKSTIESTINKMETVKTKTMFMEVQGPGDCLLLLKIEARIPTDLIHEMKVLCRKHRRSKILPNGTCRNIFEEKGIVVVAETNLDGAKVDEETATEEAIESSAEEVTSSRDEKGDCVFQFVSSVQDFYKMKQYLERKRHKIIFAETSFVTTSETELNETDLESFKNLLKKLKQLSEGNVLHVYDNVRISDNKDS